jgi:hypothetical protein
VPRLHCHPELPPAAGGQPAAAHQTRYVLPPARAGPETRPSSWRSFAKKAVAS